MNDIQKIEDNHGQIAQNVSGDQIQNNYYITLKDYQINNLMLIEKNKRYSFFDKYYLVRLSYVHFCIFNKNDEILVEISRGFEENNKTEIFIAWYFDENIKSQESDTNTDMWDLEYDERDICIYSCDISDSFKMLEAVKVHLFNLEYDYKSFTVEIIDTDKDAIPF